MDLQRWYLSMPVWVQEMGLSWYARRLDRLYYGQRFYEWAERFTGFERRSAEQIARYQQQELNNLLCVAFRDVPWFRTLAVRLGLRADEMASVDDLRRLPIMEKDPIRRHPWEFVRENYPRPELWLEKTSGTTGKSLHIYWSREMLARWWAMQEVRVRGWAGVSQEMPRAILGGRPIIRGETQRPPYWRYNRHWQQLYMSSYHVSPATMPAYIEALQRYGSRWITGYGSSIALLGEYLREHPAELPVTAALTSGDTVSPRQRQAIEDGFACRMFDNYGSSEGCCVISECEQGRLHLQPEMGVLEILDEQGEPCPPGVDGEFICTGLGNDAMPLIRYRTGDYGCWSSERSCPCGRASALIGHITGRTDDYLLLADGRQVGRLSTAMKKAPSVKQAQIVQDRLDHAWLLLVPESYYRDADGEVVVDDILSRIGERAIRLEIRLVREIPATAVGKHVLVRRIIEHAELQEQYDRLLKSEVSV